MKLLSVVAVLLATPCSALSCDQAWNYIACMYPLMHADTSDPIIGFNSLGMSSGGVLNTALLQSRSTNAPAGSDPQTVQVYMEAWTGGTNHSNGPKTNYSALTATMVARTSGQTNAISFSNMHFANGDTAGLDGVVQSWGRNNAGGDEATEAITVAALQGTVVMTGTVSAVNGNQITYSNPVNEFTRGEDRPLIITTPAKVYSQGAIVATAGFPPVVTGDGNQDWTTLGIGPVSNLFLSIDSQANGSLKMVVPVRSITDASHLVLDYVSEGNDSTLPVPALPSTYKIFRGGNVTAMPLPPQPSNSVTVAVATDFSVGDTFEQPLGYAHAINAVHIHVAQKLPCSSNVGCNAVTVDNDYDAVPFSFGFSMKGPVSAAFYADTVMVDGFQVRNNPPGALVKSTWTGGGVTNLLGAFTGAGQNTFFSYDRSVDVWKTTAPISAPLFQAPAGPGVDCNGPPTSNHRVSKGIVVAC